MNIGVICAYPIPYGMAATTRIFAYSKGLVENGDNVDVWSTVPTSFSSNLNNKNSGMFNGVYYSYSYRCKRSNNKFLHIIEMIYSLLILGKKIYKRNKSSRYDLFIVSSDSIITLLYMLIINTFFRCKLVFIFDEYPIPIRKYCKSRISKNKARLYRLILSRYTAYVSMTQNLLSFYQNLVKKPGIVVSSITDLSRFSSVKKQRKCICKQSEVKVVYMGNMELSKDNVDNILYAFALLLKKGYKATLYLYGRPSNKDKTKLDGIIRRENIQGKVFFSYATFNEVPNVLSAADILVSSQPVTVRADGGFPTKLGEYLMSETPVLLTDVGEISQYFKDNVHLFFAKPEHPTDFAERMAWIIDNYEEARSVALDGKQHIVSMYSHKAAGRNLHNFFNQI